MRCRREKLSTSYICASSAGVVSVHLGGLGMISSALYWSLLCSYVISFQLSICGSRPAIHLLCSDSRYLGVLGLPWCSLLVVEWSNIVSSCQNQLVPLLLCQLNDWDNHFLTSSLTWSSSFLGAVVSICVCLYILSSRVVTGSLVKLSTLFYLTTKTPMGPAPAKVWT